MDLLSMLSNGAFMWLVNIVVFGILLLKNVISEPEKWQMNCYATGVVFVVAILAALIFDSNYVTETVFGVGFLGCLMLD